MVWCAVLLMLFGACLWFVFGMSMIAPGCWVGWFMVVLWFFVWLAGCLIVRFGHRL